MEFSARRLRKVLTYELRKQIGTKTITIRIGNHMVSSAIWNKFERVSFQSSKLHEPVGRVLFELFENSQVQIYSKIAREKPYDFQLIIHMKKFQLQTFETGMQARSFSLRNLAKLQRAQTFLIFFLLIF